MVHRRPVAGEDQVVVRVGDALGLPKAIAESVAFVAQVHIEGIIGAARIDGYIADALAIKAARGEGCDHIIGITGRAVKNSDGVGGSAQGDDAAYRSEIDACDRICSFRRQQRLGQIDVVRGHGKSRASAKTSKRRPIFEGDRMGRLVDKLCVSAQLIGR